MTIRVLFFGQLAEVVGQASSEIDLESGDTVQHVLDALIASHSLLKPHLRSVAIAVNERYVRSDGVLKSGDTVALIPPVSGG